LKTTLKTLLPDGIVPTSVLEATSTTEIVESRPFVTYAFKPFGAMATPIGPDPTVIVETIELLDKSNLDTVDDDLLVM
jgi:hypothetical protein